jgi:hypothetical protein
MKKIYKGYLRKNECKYTLRLERDNYEVELVEKIEEDIKLYGNYLSVRYYISDKETSVDDIKEQWILKVMGISKCEYWDRYGSEWTGYMWTDEELNVGGHNLLEELKSYIDKYIVLEIDYSEEDKNTYIKQKRAKNSDLLSKDKLIG